MTGPGKRHPEQPVITCPCCGVRGKKAKGYALIEPCFRAKKREQNAGYKREKRPNNERKDELAAHWRAKQPWAYDLSAKLLQELKL